LRLAGQGDAGQRGAPAGDLLVIVRVRPDPQFRRDGADIHGTATASVLDALLGGTLSIRTVQGEATVQIPEGMQPGQTFRLRGKGLPVLNTSRFGDHYVKVDVEIPKKLSKAERKLLEEWRGMGG
jgi:molecular chaperone DnaJ